MSVVVSFISCGFRLALSNVMWCILWSILVTINYTVVRLHVGDSRPLMVKASLLSVTLFPYSVIVLTQHHCLPTTLFFIYSFIFICSKIPI